MLLDLHVKDLALVEDVWLELGPGLTALTGETGAGKTVLVEALKLLLGERADSTLVRAGAEGALVEGTFSLDGREVAVQRRVSAEGRSRCTIDGAMATVGMLAELLGPVVDLHGQHEHQALLAVSNHTGYVDRFIGAAATEALAAYRGAWDRRAEARSALASLEATLADGDRRADALRFMIADVDVIRPGAEEEAELQARLPRLRHAEKLTTAAWAGWAALNDEAGASDAVTAAAAALRTVGELDPALDEVRGRLDDIDHELRDVAGTLRGYAESIEHDPHALDRAEQRMQSLSDLKRKYGSTIEAVLEARDAAERELAELQDGSASLARARARVEESSGGLCEAAGRLSALRAEAAEAFAAALASAVADLALPRARFEVTLAPLEPESWTAEGAERIEFLFASDAGEPARPLARIASGGELSRVMLALKSVLGDADRTPTAVFDEVDAGIGGATALAVGRRLASVADSRQVLVVTHLAQVAAFADVHVVVAKERSGERTVTAVGRVEGHQRAAEIARMLAGEVSEAALTHARELLAGVSAPGAAEGRG